MLLLQFTLGLLVGLLGVSATAIEVNVTAVEGPPETDNTVFYYGKSPLLIGNDGTPDNGGFHAYNLAKPTSGSIADVYTGRAKIVATAYDIGGRDLLITIAQPDSIMRVYEGLEKGQFREIKSAQKKFLGDWNVICAWKSAESGEQYLYLYGKKQVVVILVRDEKKVELVEIQRFPVAIEAESCAITPSGLQYFSNEDDGVLYSFQAQESTRPPTISEPAEIEGVTGLATYSSQNQDYLFVALTDVITVYDKGLKSVGEIELSGLEDLEIQGMSISQGKTGNFPAGAIAFAAESEDAVGYGLISLETPLREFKIKSNARFDPGSELKRPKDTVCKACSNNGFCGGGSKGYGSGLCDCFSGWSGRDCRRSDCEDLNNCSSRGKCIGPNTCRCDGAWGGPNCTFLQVSPKFETDAYGGDGDDPAVWISPSSKEDSRVITTIKSEEGAGLAVFDLEGKNLQTFDAGEPNNVDVIYGFQAGDRTVDLTFAACREDDTLCLFEITNNGTLQDIPGGSQPTTKEDYSVYGSCVYRSRKSGKQYLFVNSQTGEYLQFELSSTANGTLQTTLVREFQGGESGQTEGCITDEENGFIFLGEESNALWRFDAEPDGSNEGLAIGRVGDGKLFADVEGVTLVLGKEPNQGFIINSCQGVSAYNVYRRAPPHEYVLTFTIVDSKDGKIDHVSNTDGITAVSTGLHKNFPGGLIVVHDDGNELPGGGTSAAASFKMVSLRDVFGAKEVRELNLLEHIDADWDPRAAL